MMDLHRIVDHAFVIIKMWSLIVLFLFISSVTCQQRFIVEPQDTYAIEGSRVVLKCTVASRLGTVVWTRNGFVLSEDRDMPGYPRYTMTGRNSFSVGNEMHSEYNLQIVDVGLQDDASFQCQVGFSVTQSGTVVTGIRSRLARLNVLLPPDQPEIESNANVVPVTLGVATNLTCVAKNGKPAANITWYKEGVRLTGNYYTASIPHADGKRVDTKGIITIVATKQDSGRRVECHAKNQALIEPFTTDAVLNVQFPPEVTMSLNVSHVIREHNFVRITCNAFANPSHITWRWYRNGHILHDETRNVLDLPSITGDYHKNTITCEPSNSVGSTKKDHQLTVEYGPKFIDKPRHIDVEKGQEAVLHCEADGNPPPSIIWTKKGSNRPLSSSPTLRIKSVSSGQFGVYICTATVLNFNEIKRQIYLLEKGPPKVMSDLKQYAAKGDDAKIECLSWSVPKPKKMAWIRNKEEIIFNTTRWLLEQNATKSTKWLSKLNSTRRFTRFDLRKFSATEEDVPYGRKSVLHIRSIEEEDFGAYNCNVVNGYGEAMVLITLIQKDVLPLPYIIGGIVGGFGVIFVIAIACFLYHRNSTGDAESFTDTESTSDKKRDKSDSPSDFKSTLMDQWRQDYNKDFYRYSEDGEDPAYKETKSNNNGYGYGQDPYILEDYRAAPNGHVIFEQDSDYGHRSDEALPAEGFESSYSTGYVPSSFRADNYEDTLPRLPPADPSSKFSTNV